MAVLYTVAIVLAAAAAAVVFLCTGQRQLYGDGIFLLGLLEEGRPYAHVVYLPLVRAVWACLEQFSVGAEQAMKVTGALNGGLAVGLAGLATAIGLERRLGFVAALLMAGLYGMWFHATATEVHAVHAASATLLLCGMVSVVRSEHPGWLALTAVALGVFLTCGSHLTGIGVLLPIVLLAWCREPVRMPFLAASALGIAGFALAYLLALRGDAGVSAHAGNHVQKALDLFSNLAYVPHLLKGCAAELTLYSLPASSLVLAGLWVTFHQDRGLCVLCAGWLLAWPLLAWPIEDRMYGAYYVPTYAVQVLLALAALRGLGLFRLLIAGVLAFLPGVALLQGHGETGALWALLGTSLVLIPVCARPGDSNLWSVLVVLVTIGFTAWLRLPDYRADPVRDQIAAVQRAVGAHDLVVVLATDPISDAHWQRFFPVAETRYANPYIVEFPPLELEDPGKWKRRQLDGVLSRMKTARAAGGKVWLVGEPLAVQAGPELRAFLDELIRDPLLQVFHR